MFISIVIIMFIIDTQFECDIFIEQTSQWDLCCWVVDADADVRGDEVQAICAALILWMVARGKIRERERNLISS